MKKSYMDKSNILSEKITLGNIFKYLTSSEFKKLPNEVPDKDLKKSLKDMNDNIKDIEKLVKKLYGQNITLPKYTKKDLKGKN